MLEAIDLTKRYEDGVLALDHLNLRVDPGEVFCLLGANGAGKTTAVNLFLNLIDPTEGTARINGFDVMREPLAAKRHVAFVSERVMLYEAFTARQNLDFFARLAHGRRAQPEEIGGALRRVGIEESAWDRKVRDFSKGMLQRLGIAIAILRETPAILLDEPTAGLDPAAGAEFLDLLRDLRRRGKAIFMSTHDIFRATEVADRVGIMRSGKLVAVLGRKELDTVDLLRIYLEWMTE